MLMFMIILHERMNIKHFQNVFDHKIFFLVKLILRLQFKETILGEQNVLSRNLLGVLSSLPLSSCLWFDNRSSKICPVVHPEFWIWPTASCGVFQPDSFFSLCKLIDLVLALTFFFHFMCGTGCRLFQPIKTS